MCKCFKNVLHHRLSTSSQNPPFKQNTSHKPFSNSHIKLSKFPSENEGKSGLHKVFLRQKVEISLLHWTEFKSAENTLNFDFAGLGSAFLILHFMGQAAHNESLQAHANEA